MSNKFFRRIRYKPHYLLVMFGLIMLFIGTINYAILLHSQKQIIEHEALRVAEVVTTQALAARSIYASAVEKLKSDGAGGGRADFQDHKGYIPIPAQFLKYLGHEAKKHNDGLYQYAPISKWNLGANQGLKDEFEHYAWAQLELQDSPNPTGPIQWKPAYRFENVNGVNTLRYMRADPAAKSTCIECHNKLEKSSEIMSRRLADHVVVGKQWKPHQLMGAIEANIPVDKVEALAATQSKITLAVILLTSILGFAYAAWLAMRDVLKERSTAQHFEQKSKYDPLTQLGNRSLFDEHGNAALNRAKQHNSRLGILFIDLDGFKPINDTYGHQAGDYVLQEVGKRLSGSLRSTDLVVRQGGDEFLVLLEGGSVYNAFVIAQKLMDILREPIEFEGNILSISASIGISRYPEHGYDLDSLIEKADAAMYHAKKQGKDGYFIWTEKNEPKKE